ncbi:MAG: hypothetical protein QOE84_2643, partial [Actinomycetota bacterium]|nr:hypothetical protein [Actinomycetota bacterium]
SDASHLYAVLGVGASEQVVSPGAVDPKAPLPVAVHLPDRQGWVVAQLGHVLEYRIGAGSWISAGHGGALLPDAATAVRVTGPGLSPTVVPLQG